MTGLGIPTQAVGLRLCRIRPDGGLVLYDAIRFLAGASAVDTVLRRAQISGRVAVGAENETYWADVMNDDGDTVIPKIPEMIGRAMSRARAA